MTEESTTPDLVERTRVLAALFEAGNRRDFDTMMSYFADDAVWEVVALGTRLEGAGAIRGFLEDWRASYEQLELEIELEEIQDLGNGVGLAVMAQAVRLAGGTGHVRYRFAQITTWADGVAIRITGSPDIDQAGVAAERLAGERE